MIPIFITSNQCLFTRFYHAVLAHLDTFIAANASGGIFDFDMAVSKEINLAEHLFGTSVETVPAAYTITRIDGDICRLVTVA